MTEAAKHTPTRDRLAVLIGSFPLHADNRGDDNQVVQDAFSGDYDARTEAVYQPADDILAEFSAASADTKSQQQPTQSEELYRGLANQEQLIESAKHTPGPWRVGDRAPYVEVWGRMQMNGYPIIASLEHEPREANAEFIVKAVNTFEARERLIETLTAALAFYAIGEGDGDWQFGEWVTKTRQDNGTIARTALAQARKG